MKHFKYALIGSPWSMPLRGPSQIIVIYPKMTRKNQKGQERPKVAKKGDFSHPSSRPVRAGLFHQIGVSKRGFPAMIAERSKMIIYSAKS